MNKITATICGCGHQIEQSRVALGLETCEACAKASPSDPIFGDPKFDYTQDGKPRNLYPIMLIGRELRVLSVPVICGEHFLDSVEQAEKDPRFQTWAVDPRTGEVRLKVEDNELYAAIKTDFRRVEGAHTLGAKKA